MASSITGTSVTRAGGGAGGAGGGGEFPSTNGGTGGSGIGGNGAGTFGNNPLATAGAVNTGSGGGGRKQGSEGATGGGSGFVAIRYSDTFPLATATTGSPTVTTTGGFRIYQWTGSGSITF